ncbi:gamma-aminobutyric acid type B receptor subunit 2-like [Tachypleus tridentatus]|uniref:gamma-aminobutyric acid type B receptor subunit 2-like n=1 Tax=Tachypleus tridentatus TaxID=6853 RepID=UPI003FCEFE5A
MSKLHLILLIYEVFSIITIEPANTDHQTSKWTERVRGPVSRTSDIWTQFSTPLSLTNQSSKSFGGHLFEKFNLKIQEDKEYSSKRLSHDEIPPSVPRSTKWLGKERTEEEEIIPPRNVISNIFESKPIKPETLLRSQTSQTDDTTKSLSFTQNQSVSSGRQPQDKTFNGRNLPNVLINEPRITTPPASQEDITDKTTVIDDLNVSCRSNGSRLSGKEENSQSPLDESPSLGIISDVKHEEKSYYVPTVNDKPQNSTNSWPRIKHKFPKREAEAKRHIRNKSPKLEKLQTFFIHGLFELTGNACRVDSLAGKTELAAAKLAIKHVNEQNVIPGCKLDMYVDDTECDSGVALYAFFNAINRKPRMVAVIGPTASDVTERLARVINYWNIVQISFGSLSPALSDQENYPLFYRTVAPDSSHNPARLEFIKYFSWDAVAILHEADDLYSLALNELVTDLEQANITLTFTESITILDYRDSLLMLKEKDLRIIVGSFSNSLAKKVFCEAYRLNLYGGYYVWILYESSEDAWWKNSSDTLCSNTELFAAVEGSFVIASYAATPENATSLSNTTTQGFINMLEEGGHFTSGFVTQAYDAVWTIALALQGLEDTKSTLRNFTLTDPKFTRKFSYNILSTKFMGVSGPISFKGSDRVGVTAFFQIQGGEPRQVALFYPNRTKLSFTCSECVPVVWKAGDIPVAHRTLIRRIATIHRGAFVVMTTLAVIGMTLAILFLMFNLYFRHLKYIKLSSPKLNNMAVIGCLLVYVAIILLGLDYGTLTTESHFSYICSARAFLLSGGFSLAFGAMFIKTHRVHQIFMRANTGLVKSKLLQDQQLIGMVCVLVLVDIFLVTLWVTVDPMERQLQNLTLQFSLVERNVEVIPQRETCHSVHMTKWLGVLYIYKGLMLAVGCYMAWETRDVQIPALNDSQYIGLSVYNVVITSILVVALANIISTEHYTLTYILVTSMIFLSTTATLMLLFLPKVHNIARNPKGDAIVASSGVTVESNTRRFVIDEQREIYYRAEVQNRVYKREILEIDREIERLQNMIETTSEPPGVEYDNSLKEVFYTNVQVNCPNSPSTTLLTQENKTGSTGSDVSQSRGMGIFNFSFLGSFKGGVKGKSLQTNRLYTSKQQGHQKRKPRRLSLNQDTHGTIRGSLPTIIISGEKQNEQTSCVSQCRSHPALQQITSMYSREESLLQDDQERCSDTRLTSAGRVSDGREQVYSFSVNTREDTYFNKTAERSLSSSSSTGDLIVSEDTWVTAPINSSLLSSPDDCFVSMKDISTEINVTPSGEPGSSFSNDLSLSNRSSRDPVIREKSFKELVNEKRQRAEKLREELYTLQRELILLEIDQSDGVDL